MADRKPKTKGVPPPEKEAPLEKPQRERFIEAARAAGVTDESLEDAVRKIAPSRGRSALAEIIRKTAEPLTLLRPSSAGPEFEPLPPKWRN